MKEILIYNNENIFDMVRALRVILRDINNFDIYHFSKEKYMTRIVGDQRLIRYEKTSRYYKFIYEGYVNVLEARTARKLLESRDMSSFIQINRNDVINIKYFMGLDSTGVILRGEEKPIAVSRNGRIALEKKLKI